MAQVRNDLAHWSGERQIISNVTQAVLNRGANDSDVKTFEDYLGAGGNMAHIVQSVATSSKSQQNITDSYSIFLSRGLSYQEMSQNENALINGSTIIDLQNSIITSTEAHQNAVNSMASRFGTTVSDADVTAAQQGVVAVWRDPNAQFQDDVNSYAMNGQLTVVKTYPPNSFTWTTPSGISIVIPNGFSFTAERMAGLRAGELQNEPFIFQNLKAAIGTFGQFDVQHDQSLGVVYTQRIDAGNYGVGVFMQGAGFNPVMTVLAGTAYSEISSGQAPSERAVQMWMAGWWDSELGSY